MLKNVIALVALCVLSGAAVVHADANQVEGSWISQDPVAVQDGIAYYIAMDVDGESAVMSSICEFPDGTSLEPSVTVPVDIDDTTINVLAAAQSELDSGADSCTVSISQASQAYMMSGVDLILDAGNGNTVTMIPRD